MNNNQGRRRVRRNRRQNKTQISRILLTICMMALIAVVSVGGTIAWLTAQTSEITNTFTTSGITVTLAETTGTQYQIIPGKNLDKDPKVTVTNDIDAYVFVKVIPTNWPEDKVTYTIADGWTAVPDVANVYYREVAANSADAAGYPVIKDNKVYVSSELNATEMATIKTNGNPMLAFTAYAIQKEGFTTAAAAWAEVSK